MRQLLNLIFQHRFYTAVCVVGTAVTLAFVMVVVMVYDLRTADVAPETLRSRLLYNTGGLVSRPDGSENYGTAGLARQAFETLFADLPGVDTLTWHSGLYKSVCSLPASSDRHSVFARRVAPNWFDLFRYEFVAGRPFTQAEYDAGRAAVQESDDSFRVYQSRTDGIDRRFVVINESLAGQVFGGADRAVGQEMLMDFLPVRVVGVVRDVSSIFQTAYADVWTPFSLANEDGLVQAIGAAGQLRGFRYAILLRQRGASPDAIRSEVERRLDALNHTGQEFVLRNVPLYTHTAYTFFRESSIDARLVYGLLLAVLLVVPAIGISGLVHAQMQGRLPEIAIRKAYGATNAGIIGRLFTESLVTTLVGGLLGYALACLLVWAGSAWLFGGGDVELSGIRTGASLLFQPILFGLALLACVVFNALSTLLPAWIAVHHNISYTLVGGE